MKTSIRHWTVVSRSLVAALAAGLALSAPARAAWNVGGNPVAQPGGNVQTRDVRVVPDGVGGTFVVWADDRSGSFDIYAQRLTSQGVPATGWPASGRAVTNLCGDQYNVQAIADGNGGVLMCWEDYRHGADNADIYAQRLTAGGQVPSGWVVDGMPVCTADHNQILPALATDKAGGTIVVWFDFRPPHLNAGIPVGYAQRMTSGGITSWSADGIQIAPNGNFSNNTPDLGVISDGAGGAIAVWSYNQLLGQHLGPSGNLLWGLGGLALNSEFSLNAVAAPDGTGGAYVAYTFSTSSQFTTSDIYVQHVSAAGSLATQDGFPACTADGDQSQPRIAFDGGSGAVVAWLDGRPGADGIYTGKVMASGVPACFANGVLVSAGLNSKHGFQVQAESQGGVLLVWDDDNTRILGQRVLGSGVIDPALPAGGVVLCDATGIQHDPALAWTASGQAIAAWEDGRSGGNPTNAVFANQLTFGTVGPATVTVTVGGMGRHSARLDWTVPASDPTYGAPNAFEIRYSTAPIDGSNWTAATLASIPLALAPGSAQCQEVDGLTPCRTYYFGIRSISCGAYSAASNSPSGSTPCSGNSEVTCDPLGALSPPQDDASAPGFELANPAPNPASSSCSFTFTLPRAGSGDDRLEVFDLSGRVIRRYSDLGAAGRHDLSWDLRDGDGRRVSGGFYWVRLHAAGQSRSRSLLVQ